MSETVSVPPCYSLLGFNCSSDSFLMLREGTSNVTQCHDQERRRAALCRGAATRTLHILCTLPAAQPAGRSEPDVRQLHSSTQISLSGYNLATRAEACPTD